MLAATALPPDSFFGGEAAGGRITEVSGGYWERDPSFPRSRRTLTLAARDVSLDVVTDRGVFGREAIDRGTHALIRTAPSPPPLTGAIDVGCGYGPIALAMAARTRASTVWAVDVNRLALELTRQNVSLNGIDNVEVSEPDAVPSMLRFASLYSNPPIKIGRDQIEASRWPARPTWLQLKPHAQVPGPPFAGGARHVRVVGRSAVT